MTREHLATHEAGHVVVCLALHLRVESVTIDGDDGHVVVSPPNRWSRLLVDLAGPLAERIILGRALATSPEDMRLFVAYPSHKRREAIMAVLAILRRRIGLVEVVAEELGRKSRLDGARLLQLEAEWNHGAAPYLGGAFLGS